jgi:hypothetical protein
MENFKWPTLLAIAALAIATWYGWYWAWGLLFIYWAIGGLLTGDAFVVQSIERESNPILFWLITAMWGGFGVWYVYSDIAWRLA